MKPFFALSQCFADGYRCQEALLPELPSFIGVLVRILYYTNLGGAGNGLQSSAADNELASPDAAAEAPALVSIADRDVPEAERRHLIASYDKATMNEVISYAVGSIMFLLLRVGKQGREYRSPGFFRGTDNVHYSIQISYGSKTSVNSSMKVTAPS